ncbi:primosomal protein N' [Sulfurospirillum sp. 1307]
MYYLIGILNSPLTPLTYHSDKKLEIGSVVEVLLNKKEKLGVVLEEVEKPSFTCSDILAFKDEFFDETTLGLAKFVSEYYVCSLGDALGLFKPFRKNSQKTEVKINSSIKLSDKQAKAYEFIKKHQNSLLFGETGSGKTEIYIKLIEDVIKEGKTAIFLMPEIGLTPQMKNRLKKVFKDSLEIWHSKVTKKKKEEILDRIYKGRVKLVAGTRSALFLPLRDLGLIVVDEEHDEAYKSNSRPRYNARDLALLFGKRKKAKVLLGSATPTLSSYENIPFFRLKDRFYTSKKSYIFEDSISDLTPSLLLKIKEHLDKNSQIIIFLPTRANFKYLTCKECGEHVTCPFCSVGMSLHVDKNALVCHYCNYTCKIPKTCPTCKKESMRAIRLGTAEVVRQLSQEFPQKVIKKFDRDEIKTNKKLHSVLKDFNDKKIDILVGTQMLSKGHDYHGVSLSVIMGIDSILGMSDFRAREKAMALVLQVAGRAGRSGNSEVFIQSKNCDFFKKFINDYEDFMKDELDFRKDFYPPYVKLLKVLISHKNDEKARKTLDEVENLAKRFNKLEIIGSGRANIEKIANKYRYNLLARSKDAKELLRFAHMLKEHDVEIDIDPLSFS